ncbi:melanoma-associated antigen 10-like [Perognathus longimembris pacificus]|uniref:melanoma-associated antigen 10-like n=1 Tax=Perognathus longimembris pacificus TaxID=214514 RepID=UPI002018F0AD|nr:melanoma-associated antigen 10-like [Perognathus longimembris pacificus]XP_048192267.1 melanoma-associated antigen 10-like [Perognathus longimembris pacificus]XP_048192268.1 melanoma-associated antigen 10-like [Perognathus longimembris pacificus]
MRRPAQKGQHSKHVLGPMAQREAPSPMIQQIPIHLHVSTFAATSFPTAQIPITHTGLPVGILHDFPSSQRVSATPMGLSSILRSHFSQVSWTQENLCLQGSMIDPESLQEDVLSLVLLMILKYKKNEVITRAEMMTCIIKSHCDYFPVIFSRVIDCMQLVFGIDVKEVEPSSHSYILAIALGLTYDGMLSDIQGLPKTGLLIVILAIVFMEGNHAPEAAVWNILCKMGVCVDQDHDVYGDPRKLVMVDFIQEQYLEYQHVPSSFPARFEFLWGPRAHAETTKVKVLEHWAKFTGCDPRSFPFLYEEALRADQQSTYP